MLKLATQCEVHQVIGRQHVQVTWPTFKKMAVLVKFGECLRITIMDMSLTFLLLVLFLYFHVSSLCSLFLLVLVFDWVYKTERKPLKVCLKHQIEV